MAQTKNLISPRSAQGKPSTATPSVASKTASAHAQPLEEDTDKLKKEIRKWENKMQPLVKISRDSAEFIMAFLT